MQFFLSLFLILAAGALLFFLCGKIHIPQLVGYLIFGIILSYFGILDADILAISSYIRKIALIIILAKAGLSLNISDLKKIGRPAIIMSFMPAVIEMCTVGIIAPLFLPLTYTESFLLGSVLGAVSPAVVIPMMTRLMDEKRGTEKGIPQLLVASSSIDDIVMIVFFQVFMTMEKGGGVSFMTFLNIPISIVLGIGAGVGVGFLIALLFSHVHIRDTFKLIIIFALAFGFTALEEFLSTWFSFSSLLAVISMCIILRLKNTIAADRLTVRCNKIWSLAEIFLFTLVGAAIKINYALNYILPALLILLCSLTMRSLTVFCALIKTKLNVKERAFTIISFLPKATVQAAMGGVLLDYAVSIMDTAMQEAGTIVLSVSVVAILLTAPLVATIMNLIYPKMLSDDSKPQEILTETQNTDNIQL